MRSIDVAAHAGTAFDGQHLYQIAEDRIQKIDPTTGRVLATIPAPGGGGDSGLAWAEGTLWVGQYRDRKIHQIDPETGAILRTIESNRFVTGVTWVDGELWHGTWEGDESELRRVDPQTGEVLEQLEMPPGVGVSGLESDGGDRFFCGGGKSGKVRAVRRPRGANSRCLTTAPSFRAKARSAVVEESPSSWPNGSIRARHSERRREAPQSRNRRRPGRMVDQSPSFRAKARSAVVEESPSSRPNGSLSGRLRFLDSLRSLGMTRRAGRMALGTAAIPRLARSLGMTMPLVRAEWLLRDVRFLDSLRSLGMTTGPLFGTAAIPRLAALARNDILYRDDCDSSTRFARSE